MVQLGEKMKERESERMLFLFPSFGVCLRSLSSTKPLQYTFIAAAAAANAVPDEAILLGLDEGLSRGELPPPADEARAGDLACMLLSPSDFPYMQV
jgi:hypothetical protein